MKNQMAIVKNVTALREAFDALANRDHGIPGMSLVCGETGFGKTTAIAWLVNQVGGVYVRAYASWTLSAMLGAIMKELGASPISGNGANARMVDHIIQKLAMSGKPLFIDEADYILKDERMVDSARDIHDTSGCPVTIIGMKNFDRKVVHRAQLAGRISHWVRFAPADLEDARELTTTVCEVEIAEDLLEQLHRQSGGSMRLMVIALARIEALAKANSWKKVDEHKWGARELFLGGAPKAVGAH
jgi:DNA transposition AAA+ family ATPase